MNLAIYSILEKGQWYNESIRTQDTFTLTVDISDITSSQELTLARYYEEEDVWLPLVSYIKGGALVAESLHQTDSLPSSVRANIFVNAVVK